MSNRPSIPGAGIGASSSTPGKAAASPKGDKPEAKPGQSKGKKRGGVRWVPAGLLLIFVIVLGLVYSGVRSARIQLEQKTPESSPFSEQGQEDLAVRFAYPGTWKSSPQDPPGMAKSRWAVGPKGNKDIAFFITRYELTREPENERGQQLVRREIEASLASTGAPDNFTDKRTQGELDGQAGWQYRYTTQGLSIRVLVVVKGKDLYQFACQSKPGKPGRAMRKQCAMVEESLEFS